MYNPLCNSVTCWVITWSATFFALYFGRMRDNFHLLLRHHCDFLQENLFQGEGHQHNVICWLKHMEKPVGLLSRGFPPCYLVSLY